MSKKKLNFKVTLDGMYSGIELTDRPVDDVYNIFGTLTEAKNEILSNHRNLIELYRENMAGIRSLTLKDLEKQYNEK